MHMYMHAYIYTHSVQIPVPGISCFLSQSDGIHYALKLLLIIRTLTGKISKSQRDFMTHLTSRKQIQKSIPTQRLELRSL